MTNTFQARELNVQELRAVVASARAMRNAALRDAIIGFVARLRRMVSHNAATRTEVNGTAGRHTA